MYKGPGFDETPVIPALQGVEAEVRGLEVLRSSSATRKTGLYEGSLNNTQREKAHLPQS